MSLRFFLLVGTRSAARMQILDRVACATGLTIAYSSEQLAALVSPNCACLAIDDAGCVLGSLFHRNGPAKPIASLASAERSRISSTEGNALLDQFWGSYVAAITSPAHARILRDPSGNLSCYYAAYEDFLLAASDAELLNIAGIPGNIDTEEIGRQFYRAMVPVPSTALRGIRELLAGFALRTGDKQQAPFWSPWDHVSEGTECAEAMTANVSRVIRHCVHSSASSHSRILLSVSGGLDSSVIAACLANSDARTCCLTMFSADPVGDERRYARALCNHLGLPLIERPYRLEDVDISKALAPHLPRPRDRTQATAYERVHLEVALETGADVFMSGNGGDSVFGYSQSAAPVADRYLREGLRSRLFATLLDVCRQTGCNIPDALGQAWRLANRQPGFRIAPKPLFLNPEFVEGLEQSETWHPWLHAPVGALPGKAAHIASILRVQSHLEASGGYRIPVLNPLMAQPIVEACLAIPSWEWRTDGRDRSVVRRAFATDLPALIVNRRVKGSPSGFGANLIDHFRTEIRERVLGGRLAADHIVDRVAIESILTSERPIPHAERVRILEILNAEAWIDHWAGARATRCKTA